VTDYLATKRKILVWRVTSGGSGELNKEDSVMKKLLILMLVLGMASWANATLSPALSLVDTTGSSPYDVDDVVSLKVVLNTGYEIDAYDLELTHTDTAALDGEFGGSVTQMSGGFAPSSSLGVDLITASDMFFSNQVGAGDILWGFDITLSKVDGNNMVITLAGGGAGGRYKATGGAWVNYSAGEVLATLDLPTVPEPITIALLGLGGLFLYRRK
jgi:hypothetical protein